ncbi:MAG: hypothetical protein V4587_04275 [Acidobacteriota bacterium]
MKMLLVMAPVTLLLACGKQQASRDDVHSDLIKSISLASESETFVRYLRQHRSTYYFASGYLNDLLNEVNRTAKELSNLNASPDLMDALNVDRVQLSLLAVQIDNVDRHLQQADVLAASEDQIRKIRMSLVQANSSL